MASPDITTINAGQEAPAPNVKGRPEAELGAPDLKETSMNAEAVGQGLSGYEELSLWQTFKAFKVCALTCFAVAFSAATDGYQIGINGNIIANLGFVEEFATQTSADGSPALASPIMGAWGAIMSVGQIIGMSTLPFLSNRWGRKTAMYTYWFILTMSVLAETLARTWPIWLVGKLLAGIGVGCLQTTVPTYISETAPVRIRGALLMAYNFWFGVGGFFAPIALHIHSKTDRYDWLTPVYSQWGHIGLMLLIYLCVPETPAWCATRGKDTEAKKSLRRLYWDIKDFDVDHYYHLLRITVEHEAEVAKAANNEKWYAIFKGTNGRRTLTALWTLMTQQFIGLTLFGSYSSYFFQQSGISEPFQATSILGAIKIASGIAMIFLADTYGRRNMSCGGSTLCWFSCVAIGILGVTPHTGASNYLLVTFSCFWYVGLTANAATGWGFIGEMSSQRLRSYTAGFGAASTCVAGVVMSMLTPYMVNKNDWGWELKTAWFYAGIGLFFVISMWFIIPETKGRSAAELDELFERKIKPWRFHKTQTATQALLEARK